MDDAELDSIVNYQEDSDCRNYNQPDGIGKSTADCQMWRNAR